MLGRMVHHQILAKKATPTSVRVDHLLNIYTNLSDVFQGYQVFITLVIAS